MTKSHHDYRRIETIEILLITIRIIIICEEINGKTWDIRSGIVKAILLILHAMAWEHESKIENLGTTNSDKLSI